MRSSAAFTTFAAAPQAGASMAYRTATGNSPSCVHNPSAVRRSGFTYLGALLAVALMGIASAIAGEVWHTAQMREKEAELLYIGNEYRRAIGQYFESTPGSAKRYPRELTELLID